MHLLLIAEIPGHQVFDVPVEFSIIRKYIHITIGPGPTTEMKKIVGMEKRIKLCGGSGQYILPTSN